ncbi:hypothetical protein BU26DRAFT_522297 [Trematosphaeria pertusa]|uniref:Aminoglycoside phosphotransferase domain-containing protein n=1 Tax=Trematosphaeria pertusa TaxID=390896 RepID=A0A6A6I582_9PLEO|nr:uncharacterized protein BU26DRAFT_522297 [Trematosphaeria pertusa]KAF2245198.1 hypothetical protein BU26DRAFT_522297 [Trematosphaeria pertusa]
MTTSHEALLPDHEIVELCTVTAPFAGSPHGNQLVKISDNVAVKFGLGVRKQEAQNQSYAHRHVDSTVLYIPQVFRFFRATLFGFDMGFIVMEYVLGINLDTLNVVEKPHLAERTMEAIQHLAMIPIPPDQGPGPVGGGSAYGYLWSDDGTGQSWESIKDMEEWMNKRLDVVKQPRISLARHQQLSMHHMDLVRRNILLLPNSSVCFVDWAFAGFFPDIFEIHTFQDLLSTDSVWFKQLLHLSQKPNDNDKQVLQYLGIPAVVNNRFSFENNAYSSNLPHSETPLPPALPPFSAL